MLRGALSHHRSHHTRWESVSGIVMPAPRGARSSAWGPSFAVAMLRVGLTWVCGHRRQSTPALLLPFSPSAQFRKRGAPDVSHWLLPSSPLVRVPGGPGLPHLQSCVSRPRSPVEGPKSNKVWSQWFLLFSGDVLHRGGPCFS